MRLRMNRVGLIGRLTKDPELRQASGSASCRFTLAVDRYRSSQGKSETDFIGCIAFGKTAENMGRYLHKGSKVGVDGRIQTGSYVNRQGTKVYTTDVIADHIDFLDSRSEDTTQTSYDQGAAYGYAYGWGGSR